MEYSAIFLAGAAATTTAAGGFVVAGFAAAAVADDEGHFEATARHAHLAYRHQLNAVQYAEIAAMESDSLDDEFDSAAAIQAE